jgi:Icc-related predicted phosphoesterase
MIKDMDRRDFLKLMGIGGIGVVFVSGLGSMAKAAGYSAMKDDFFFIQLSDTHWGFTGAAVNPDATGTLKKAVAAINKLKSQPDFIIFTGDLTHNTEDSKERRKRMAEFRDIIKDLKVSAIRFLPGEHDASMDNGEAFEEFFGKTHYTFDHKGVHFITLDNVSDPKGNLGETQLQWLGEEMKKLDKDSRIIVLTHRPLFDLYPQWEWATPDGAKAIEILMPYTNVTVFYGHIHQEHHDMTGHIPHHAAKGLMYPLPAPGSVPKRAPVPWDASAPYKGLGFRGVEAKISKKECVITEYPIQES